MFGKFKNINAAIKDYISHFPGGKEAMEAAGIAFVEVSALPDRYNNTPYETYVSGQAVHTVGEYKAAVRAGDDMNWGNPDTTDWSSI